ncbi:hypothetical protein PHYSODRAFT_332832 [Phytophthora sojae]|uniref:FYVE-type domain-containing protein n=1 Tax=Phytophthora sojae (strain P6497) TaxID=1094619 RepID=G4ZQ56_PHYSP|nr:hypothetical protein PHYSODRAFT_332832 [Phytophthora sojae]EGZ14445.1 hypothetical protein PHYSODRAFT_332832 [Phytophthora sojae]|eukprot:XP_009528194.1 hypothetical protein PHYSODRAFT_332832 [Phytophthora sojae]
MGKDRFSDNPYPNVQVSENDRRVLIDLVSGFVDDNFQEYEEFVEIDQQIVDERRWKLAKSRDNQHVYAARNRDANFEPWKTVGVNDEKPQGKALPSVLSVGTFNGGLDDLMFGAVNPTQDSMRVKASYVGDVDSAAILCPVVEPSEEMPFQSLIIKWMTIDLPLQAMSLVKRRDFVYIEATGFVYLANGERVGYYLLHSIEFPETKPLPNTIRGNLSIFGFFRQVDDNVIEHYARGTIDPGGEIKRFMWSSTAVETMLSVAKCVQCGQMKKLAWMLQQNNVANKRKSHMQSAHCSMCEKSLLCPISGKQLVGSSTCKLCHGPVCRSCKIRKRLSFIELDGKLDKRKVSFCASCITNATELSAELAAKEQATGYNVYTRFKSVSSTTSSQTDISENSSFLDDELQAIMEDSDEDEDIPLLSDLSPSEAIPLVF